jgi:hypothetical protein
MIAILHLRSRPGIDAANTLDKTPKKLTPVGRSLGLRLQAWHINDQRLAGEFTHWQRWPPA